MQHRFSPSSVIGKSVLLAVVAVSAHADDAAQQVVSNPSPVPENARTAIERGLGFLRADATRWRQERTCSTCHHGTMTVWALSEAKALGYETDPDFLREMTKWTKERLEGLDKPRDTRPGWKMVNTPAVYLAMMPQKVASDAIEVCR
jgi:hypothetical protein